MENRGQKRTEVVNRLPADKRACNSLEFRPSTSNSSVPESPTHESHEADMDTSSSNSGSVQSEGDGGKESAYGSYDSEGSIHDYYRPSAADQGKLRGVLDSLSEEKEESGQLALLTELCELLSFSSDGSLSSLMVDSFSPVLVNLAKHETNADIMLSATRAITYLCDINNRASGILVRHDVAPALCQRLEAIEDFDVVEQCLQALEKISREQPVACLRSGAIMSALHYIDFFSTSVQRVALSCVVNISKKLSSESPSLFMEAVPILCNLLQYEDKQLVESAVACLIKIGEAISSSPGMLDEICKHGLIQQMLHLIGSNNNSTLCQQTCIGLMGLLVKLASGSTVAFKTLLELDISSRVKDMLSNHDLSHGILSNPTMDGYYSQVHEVLKLLNVLLPTVNSEKVGGENSDKEAAFLNHPDILKNFGMNVFPTLIKVINSGVNLFLCYGSLCVIYKLLHLSATDTLGDLLRTANFSSLLAGVLMRKDHHVLSLALQIVETIMLKLPQVYMRSFRKEGVLYAINGLLSPDSELRLSPIPYGTQLDNNANIKSSRDVYRCPCYAFDQYASPKSLESGTCKLQEDTVHELARHVWKTYFEAKSLDSVKGVTDILQKLRTLSCALTVMVDKSLNDVACSGYEEEIYKILHQIMSWFNEKDSISTFEFVESGIVKAIIKYLFNCRSCTELEDSDNVSNFCVMRKRFEVFGQLILSSVESDRLLTLTRKLHSALSSVECFPVISNPNSKRKNSFATVPFGRCSSNPCLKVQFVRENGDACLLEYSRDTVTVDPFVGLDEIERYLWPLVKNEESDVLNSSFEELKEKDLIASGERSVDVTGFTDMLVDGGKLKDGKQNSLSSLGEETSGSTRKTMDSTACTDIEPGRQCARQVGGSTSSSGSQDASAKFLFYLEGQVLNRELPLYQSILKLESQTKRGDNPDGIWTRVHKITYKRNATTHSSHAKVLHNETQSSSLYERSLFFQYNSFFNGMLVSEADLEIFGPTYDMLALLKILEGINRSGSHLMHYHKTRSFAEGSIEELDKLNVMVREIPENEFVNGKLTEKLEQLMRDPKTVSVGALLPWCWQLMAWCPFLFSFEARCKYFHLLAFGKTPVQTQVGFDIDGVPRGRQQNRGNIPRKKILVHRNRVLESADEMMELYTRQKSVPEVEFNEEVGTGLGPTLEFYTLVSLEFRRSGSGMWRDDCETVGTEDENSEPLLSPFGLFPRPWPPSASGSSAYLKVIRRFTLLGQMLAKALKDGRVLDLPLSKAFYKLILGKELTAYDIQSFDPAFGRAILEFHAVLERRYYFLSRCEERSPNFDLCLQNTKIEDLCLDFTLPGYPDYALGSETSGKMVDSYNLEEYVKLVVDATIRSGISRQVEAFRSGFDQVFPIRHLEIFTEEELERLLCGEHVLWNPDEFSDHVKFDHGYTLTSPPIVNFLEIVREFNREQQRAFLQFVTGAPRLPIGGLTSLSPKLTIVRKQCSCGVDSDLPSVMTCANYLKLPPYSSKEIMKEKLLYAIMEGQGSFHLS